MRDVSLIPPELIDAAEFARMLSVSKPTIWRMLSAQKIPEPIRLTSQCLRWRRAAVLEWIDEGCPCPSRTAIDLATSATQGIKA